MLLISHFWHLFLLVHLLFSGLPQPSTAQVDITEPCWVVQDNKPFSNDEYCPLAPPDTTICAIDKQTGLGVGCATQADCPPMPKKDQIHCGSSEKYCCCRGNSCSLLYDGKYEKERNCEDPILAKTDFCKPPVYCLKPGKPHPENCGQQPIGKPYCKLDPKTGNPLGCGDAYPKNSAECELMKPTDAMLKCNDKVCCCKGTPGVDNMPCNRLSKEACKIKELAGLDKCKDPVTLPMMNETHPVPGGSTTDATGGKVTPKTEDGNTGSWGSGIWNCCFLLFIVEQALIYIL